MELKSVIAKNIIQLRQSAGMTQLDLAEKMNYSGIYSFSKSFKEHYGISPRQYLKQMSETQRQENANEKDDL